MNILFTKDAWKENQNHQKGEVGKINKFIKEIQRTPYEGSGNPEALKHDLTGYYSRRISGEHRLVYMITTIGVAETLFVTSCWGHY